LEIGFLQMDANIFTNPSLDFALREPRFFNQVFDTVPIEELRTEAFRPVGVIWAIVEDSAILFESSFSFRFFYTLLSNQDLRGFINVPDVVKDSPSVPDFGAQIERGLLNYLVTLTLDFSYLFEGR
jgi:hypothetical protein